MSHPRRLSICLATLLLLTGCGGEKKEFRKLGKVTRIRVVDSMDHDIRPEITDAQRIEQLVGFFDARRSGWTKPWYGVPVASVRAEFYDGSLPNGYIGVGVNFFEGGGISFWSKDATPSEIQQFMDLVEVPREKVKR
jgi:hypothetical protein